MRRRTVGPRVRPTYAFTARRVSGLWTDSKRTSARRFAPWRSRRTGALAASRPRLRPPVPLWRRRCRCSVARCGSTRRRSGEGADRRPADPAEGDAGGPEAAWRAGESLTEAKAAGNLSRRLRVLTHPALLVVDEIGYLPISQDGAVLFFQLINARHERASTVFTSNKGFEEWGGVLGDEIMAAALIDRLLHHPTSSTSGATATASGRIRTCSGPRPTITGKTGHDNRPPPLGARPVSASGRSAPYARQRSPWGGPHSCYASPTSFRVGHFQLPQVGHFRFPLTRPFVDSAGSSRSRAALSRRRLSRLRTLVWQRAPCPGRRPDVERVHLPDPPAFGYHLDRAAPTAGTERGPPQSKKGRAAIPGTRWFFGHRGRRAIGRPLRRYPSRRPTGRRPTD